MKEFQGNVAVVTGAASGIGRALAEKCAALGMKVVLADIEEPALKQAEEELQVSGAQVLAVRTDVSQAEEVEALAQRTYETYGAVHLLFNNAGVGGGTTVWESSLADWQWVLGVNLWGVIHGIHCFVPRMLAQGSEGHIVNTASSTGLVASSGLGIYKVSKHGVVTLSETLACELAMREARLKASVLCPEWVNTRILDAERNRPQALQNAPEERHTSPETAAMAETLRQAFREWLAKEGMPPSQVAERVFEAIRQEQFYIFTHPTTKDVVQVRMEDILQERMPTDLFRSPPVISQFRSHTQLKKTATQQEEGEHPIELPSLLMERTAIP
jgi:NAD(P)-dependent dehydrogenase (short-subunit alcohol dehydrogenase family)